MHFARFLFGEPHQLVVQVDGFQRLDEQGVAAGAGAVDHAVQFAALPGDHRHHEALVADGDELLLQDALFAMGAQKALERFLNGASSGARCRGAGAPSATLAWSATLPSGRILPSRSFSSARKSPMVCARRPSRGKRSAAAVSTHLASAARSSRAKTSKDLLRLQAGAFDAQLVDEGFDVRQDR